jgi:hypothetical protein
MWGIPPQMKENLRPAHLWCLTIGKMDAIGEMLGIIPQIKGTLLVLVPTSDGWH